MVYVNSQVIDFKFSALVKKMSNSMFIFKLWVSEEIMDILIFKFMSWARGKAGAVQHAGAHLVLLNVSC